MMPPRVLASGQKPCGGNNENRSGKTIVEIIVGFSIALKLCPVVSDILSGPFSI